jgi:hypothetical protein
LIKGFDEKRCLGCCSPDPCEGPLTVSEPWPIEANNAVAGRNMIHESADDKILNQRAVAMEQYHAGSCTITALEVVETHPVALDEVADWWVLSLGHERKHDVPYDQNEEDNNEDGSGFADGHSRVPRKSATD